MSGAAYICKSHLLLSKPGLKLIVEEARKVSRIEFYKREIISDRKTMKNCTETLKNGAAGKEQEEFSVSSKRLRLC